MSNARARVLVLMGCDVMTLALSWLIASLIYAFFNGVEPSVWFCLVRKSLVGSYLLLNVFARLYHGNPLYPGFPLPPISEFSRLILTSFGAGLIFFSYRYVSTIVEADMSAVAVFAVLVNMVISQPARNLCRGLMFKFARRLFSIPVVLLCGERGPALLPALSDDAHLGVRVVARFSEVEAAVDYSSRYGVRHCVCMLESGVVRDSMTLLLSAFPVLVKMPASGGMPLAATYPVEFKGIGGVELVNRSSYKLYRLLKKLLEFSLVLLACAVFVLPASFIALAIWLSDPRSPVFYGAKRKGVGGCDITVYKFRTMVPDADALLTKLLEENEDLRQEWSRNFKLDRDPRITRIGLWLRKASLDELPQLINVIKGDMALIGPRPIVEKEIGYYGAAYREFASVKPGITGLWQVSGRSQTNYATRVALDLYYVRNWSVWMDLWIIRSTIGVVLRGTGAK